MKDFKNLVWAEAYRPKSIDEYIFSDPALEERVGKWINDGVFPNMVLAGIQGTGKSSLARVLINEFDIDNGDTLFVDGSVYNKVDDVRDTIIPFTSIAPMSAFKVIVIEEAHRLTPDAQSALYDTIESSSSHVRFIFTTNFPKKISAPILSRCPLFTFDKFNRDQVTMRIADILEDKGVAPDDEESFENIESHIDMFKPDIRLIITSIQDSIVDDGERILPPSNSIKSSSIDGWIALWQDEDATKQDFLDMVYLADQTNFELFYTAIYEHGLHQFGEDHRGEAVVHISDFLSKAMGSSTQGIQSIHLEALIHTLFDYMGD